MNLNHLHIGTRDLAGSRKFYETFLGFRKKFDHDPGVFLENDAGFLLAIDPVEEVPALPSWFHLGFCLSSEEEAFHMLDRAKSLKVNIVREMMHSPGNYASFFVADSDGYKIELSWHRE